MTDGLSDAARMTQQAQEAKARLQAELTKVDPGGVKRAKVNELFGRLVAALVLLPETDSTLQDVRRVWSSFERDYA